MSSSIELGYAVPEINSAGGVKVSQIFVNATNKDIKYLTFFYTPYNAVGDIAPCTISKNTVAKCRLTGPIEARSYDVVSWDVLWYNPTVIRVEVDKLYVEYMDGTSETIEGNDIVNIDDENSLYKQIEEEKNKAYEEEVRALEEERKAEEEKRRLEEEEKRRLEEEKAEEKRKLDERKKVLKKPYLLFGIFSSFAKAKEDEEIKFHTNQGICLFILEVLAILVAILVPSVGLYIGIGLFVFALIIANKGMTAIDKGTRFEIPLISKIKFFK